MSPKKCPMYQALTEKCRDSVGNLPTKGALYLVSLFVNIVALPCEDRANFSFIEEECKFSVFCIHRKCIHNVDIFDCIETKSPATEQGF